MHRYQTIAFIHVVILNYILYILLVYFYRVSFVLLHVDGGVQWRYVASNDPITMCVSEDCCFIEQN